MKEIDKDKKRVSVKELKAIIIELKGQLEEANNKAECSEQVATLEASFKSKEQDLSASKTKLELLEKENEKLKNNLNKLEKEKGKTVLNTTANKDKQEDYSIEQIKEAKTKWVVIDDMTGLVTMPDGSIVKTQVLACDVSGFGSNGVFIVGVIGKNVTITPNVSGLEISQTEIAGIKRHTLLAV